MEPVDEGVDERLRSLARANPVLAERVSAAALAAGAASPVASSRFAVVAASLVVVLVGLGLGLLGNGALREPIRDATSTAATGVVLVRAADGTAAIYSGGSDEPQPPPGTGFVISEGGVR